MRITIGNFVLCGGTETNQFPEQFSVDGSQILDVQQALRAKAVRVVDRGNTTTSISFAVTREHASYLAACAFAMAHHHEIPKSGVVALVCQTPGAQTYYLQDGRLQSTRCSPIVGVSTVHAYTLIGGAVSTSQPSA